MAEDYGESVAAATGGAASNVVTALKVRGACDDARLCASSLDGASWGERAQRTRHPTH